MFSSVFVTQSYCSLNLTCRCTNLDKKDFLQNPFLLGVSNVKKRKRKIPDKYMLFQVA